MVFQIVKFIIGLTFAYGLGFLAYESLILDRSIPIIVYWIFWFISISLLWLSYKRAIELVKERKK